MKSVPCLLNSIAFPSPCVMLLNKCTVFISGPLEGAVVTYKMFMYNGDCLTFSVHIRANT